MQTFLYKLIFDRSRPSLIITLFITKTFFKKTAKLKNRSNQYSSSNQIVYVKMFTVDDH